MDTEAKPAKAGDGATKAGDDAAALLKQLCSAIVAARGPILDRVERAVVKFDGSGSVDIAAWLENLEKRCTLESVAPEEIVGYLLGGNALRVYRQLTVAEASQWEVVSGRLLAEYGLPRHEAWRRFKLRRLAVDEAVDVYVDELQRLGARVGLDSASMAFRAQFYEGLPAGEFEWAVMKADAFTADFGQVLSRVRDRLAVKQSVACRGGGERAASAAPGPAAQGCFRCGGNHLVRDCSAGRAAGRRRATSRDRQPPSKKAAGGKRQGCFRCGKQGHFVRECRESAAAVVEQLGFQKGGESGGNPPPSMETE